MVHLYQSRRPAPVDLCLESGWSCLPRHRLVQGQNRQSGRARHRLARTRRGRLSRSTPATLLQGRSTPTRSHMAGFVPAFPLDAPDTLALDRTRWMPGKIPGNVPGLSVVHDGIAFALSCQVLTKKTVPIPRSALNGWGPSRCSVATGLTAGWRSENVSAPPGSPGSEPITASESGTT